MLEMILKTTDAFSGNGKSAGIKNEFLKSLTRNEKAVLRLLAEYFTVDDIITIENTTELIGKSPSTIRGYFKSFTDKGILFATGENKGRKYKLNANIFE
jgi:transposase